MAKVAIRLGVKGARGARWQFANFRGPKGGESVGVVDLIAVRKDHHRPAELRGLNPGDALQIILIQVKGGSAANPTPADGVRLRILKKHHRASHVLLASWKPGNLPKPGTTTFYTLRDKPLATLKGLEREWEKVGVADVFGPQGRSPGVVRARQRSSAIARAKR
jgi:hypothetical protein